jgi:hypothetical protein
LRDVEVQQWAEKARQARIALTGVRKGEREAALRGLAGKRDANTLRRWIAALQFVDEIAGKSKALGAVLVQAPVSVVELFGRWHGFDPEGAGKEMRAWCKQGGSVRLIGERMLDARKRFKVHPSRSLEKSHRLRMKESVKHIVGAMVGGDLTEPSLNFKDSDLPPVDYLFHSVNPSDLVTIRIAAIIVGPFSNPDMYRRRRHDALMKAFAFAWVYERVILLLPNGEELAEYLEWIDRFHRRIAGRKGGGNRKAELSNPCIPSVEAVAIADRRRVRRSR